MIFVLCAAAAYAQVGVSSIPVTTVRSTGRAELAGSVRLTASGVNAADTFTIRYGLPITNSAATGMSVSGNWPGCAIFGVDNAGGIVTVTCGVSAATNYFQLDGVRVSIDGFAGNAVNVTIGALTTPITAGQNSATVIESVAVGLKTALAGQQTLTYLASSKTATVTPGRLVLSENFASSFKSLVDEGPGATQATKILLTFSPALPTGYTVTIADAGNNALGQPYTSATLTYALSGTTFSSTTTQQTITILGESTAAVETLGLSFTLAFDLSVGLPLPPADFFVTATLTPNDPALTTLNAVYTPYLAPKFAVANVPSDAGQRIITIVPASTTLLIPYVTTDAGYDSGLAIANTTTDPFPTLPPPSQSATKQNGTIKFYFYPNDGSTIAPYTTAAASPGAGLTAGVLNSGSTYVVLLSSLLSAAGRTTPFTGYILAVVGANQCHGAAFVSDFSGKFTSAAPMLVIPNPAITKRSGVGDELLLQ